MTCISVTVQLEVMYAERPVIAVSSAGLLESVASGKVGYLCDPDPTAFATKMKLLAENKDLADSLGRAGRQHTMENYSFKAFSTKLDSCLHATVKKRSDSAKNRNDSSWTSWLLMTSLVLIFAPLALGGYLAAK
jgi:hypothetical protein